MEVITHWAGNIVSYLVFLTVLTGLLPAHKYEKYIRLFAGCILLLIVLKPLTDGLRLEERLNYLFTSLSFENEAGELKREMDEIEERRRNMVLSQYEAEALTAWMPRRKRLFMRWASGIFMYSRKN